MNFEEILSAISNLAVEHSKSADQEEDLKDTDWLENDAFNLIVEYSKHMKYQVDNFPESLINDDADEITDEHWMLYIDKLTLTNSDVADLHWHWVSSFWPDQFKDKKEFIGSVSNRISGGFYDVSI